MTRQIGFILPHVLSAFRPQSPEEEEEEKSGAFVILAFKKLSQGLIPHIQKHGYNRKRTGH